MIVGGVVGMLAFAAGLNEMPASWYGYDTATSPIAFQEMIAFGAIAAGAVTTLLIGFTLAAAESATRQAFPHQLDWWKLWRYRGTTEVAARVAGGYATACIGKWHLTTGEDGNYTGLRQEAAHFYGFDVTQTAEKST